LIPPPQARSLRPRAPGERPALPEAREMPLGGGGQQTDMQQPRYGQQVLDIINPF